MTNLFRMYNMPLDEQDAIFHLAGLLSQLERYAKSFDHCIDLNENCQHWLTDAEAKRIKAEVDVESRRAARDEYTRVVDPISTWQFAAAHEAVMQLYNFRIIFDAVWTDVKKIRIFGSYFDRDRYRKTKELFDASFPDNKGMRNAVSHLAEVSRTVERNATEEPFDGENLQVKGGGPYMIQNAFDGNNYVNVHETVNRTLEMTHANTDKLFEIISQLHQCFEPVIQKCASISHSERIGPKVRP